VGVRVGVAYSRNKLALRSRLRNLNLRSQCSRCIKKECVQNQSIRGHIYDSLKFVGVKVGVARVTGIQIIKM